MPNGMWQAAQKTKREEFHAKIAKKQRSPRVVEIMIGHRLVMTSIRSTSLGALCFFAIFA
ncbi:hypothetical protein [Zavarzinella formosa]|uniref:hypothetical protein n=1 Tax=Zavarzinella formosa TaxID=360055 RepID=UPI000496A246|nr:hypothetical protein [Zavarzinella formosa]